MIKFSFNLNVTLQLYIPFRKWQVVTEKRQGGCTKMKFPSSVFPYSTTLGKYLIWQCVFAYNAFQVIVFENLHEFPTN